MAEIRSNVKNIQQSGLLLVGVDVSKTKHDACKTQCQHVKNEDMLEWVTYLWTYCGFTLNLDDILLTNYRRVVKIRKVIGKNTNR